MKLKFIAAACMALCASASFAAAAKIVCPATPTTSDLVNKCAPEVTLYVAGSSALGGALSTVVVADLFDSAAAVGITKVADTGSLNGSTGTGGVSTWYGMSKAALTGGTSKRLFVVYNKQNGSAAGVSQLLSTIKDTTIPEQDVVTVGPVNATTVNTCTVGTDTAATSSAPLFHNASCATHARTQADLAISDVAPVELFALEGVKPAALTTLTSTPLALQGFAIGVNAVFYNALQTQNLAEGLIPSTCTAGNLTAACQPTIRRADYASLVTTQGAIKSAAGFIPADTTVLTLSRRDDLSGTQASSNIFFADNACGKNVTSAAVPKAIAGHLGGYLNILATTPNATKLVINKNATGGGVTTDLGATSGYAIGVISLSTDEPTRTSSSWKYVKIDGVSPNFNADGSAAYKQRTAFTNGNYSFAMTAYGVTTVTAAKAGYAKLALTNAVIGGLKDSTLHDLTGVGYLDGAADVAGTPKQALVHRTNGNNCSPLIK